MRTIAIVNQKGGCGKTTTAINLAAVYARRGFRTLLVDLDPQAHCSAGLGVPDDRVDFSVADALVAAAPEALDVHGRALTWGVARSFDLLPSAMRLAALEAPGGGLHALDDRDRRLARVLQAFAGSYDRCLIDCPPTIGLLTFNALVAAREVLVPVETGYFSLRGAERQWETIQRVIRRIGRPIACHILPTMYDESHQLATDILRTLRRRFAGQVMPIAIREHDALREAASMGQAITEYAPDSDANRDHEALAQWLEDNAGQGSRPGGGPIPARADDPPDVEITRVGRERFVAELGPGPVAVETMRHPDPVGNHRAAEVVVRLRERALQGPAAESLAPGREPAPMVRVVEAAVPAAPQPQPEIICYGVHVSPRGVRFVQPADEGPLYVAGDFNRWSPSATPLPMRPDRRAREAVLDLAPGRYSYRVVRGGRWQADPYNDRRDANEHGESHSVVIVPAGTADRPAPPAVDAASMPAPGPSPELGHDRVGDRIPGGVNR